MRLLFADIHFASAMHTSPERSVIIIPYGKTLVNASVKALLQLLFETIFIFLIDSLFNADVACKGSDNKF